MAFTQITQSLWLTAPHEVRMALAKHFGLTPTEARQVEKNGEVTIVKSDGYSNEDLKGITKVKLAEYVGHDGDFYDLYEEAVAKVKGIIVQQPTNGAPFVYGTKGKSPEKHGGKLKAETPEAPDISKP